MLAAWHHTHRHLLLLCFWLFDEKLRSFRVVKHKASINAIQYVRTYPAVSDRLPLGVDSQQNYNKVFELSSKTDKKKKRQQKSSQKLDELNMVIHKFCSLRCFSTFQRLLNYKPSFSLPAVGREGLGGLVWIGLCSYSFISFAWPKETKGKEKSRLWRLRCQKFVVSVSAKSNSLRSNSDLAFRHAQLDFWHTRQGRFFLLEKDFFRLAAYANFSRRCYLCSAKRMSVKVWGVGGWRRCSTADSILCFGVRQQVCFYIIDNQYIMKNIEKF